MTQLPRGLRNNNPGNIRLSKDKWKGLRQEQTDGTFFHFISRSDRWGYRDLIPHASELPPSARMPYHRGIH